MVKVYVAERFTGPSVTEVKGIRAGREWVANEVEKALAYDPDGTIGIRWSEVDIPASLRRRILVVQEVSQ